jgi:putative NIF3 family GTP cyclohydrolase 1 type 2
MDRITRREFVALAAAGGAAAPALGSRGVRAATLTAQEVVDRIRRNAGVDWKAETVDGFKAGDPGAAVAGIATTAMPTLEVLERTVKAGANLVITCEPTFFSRADTATPPRRGPAAGPAAPTQTGQPVPPSAPDAVFAAKHAFIRKHGLVVYRFSDHWRQRTPNPFARGLIDALGWSSLSSVDDPGRVSIPEIRLDALAVRIKTALNAAGGVRVIGDPGTTLRRIGLLPGSTPIQASLNMLPGVDGILAGEVREWESVEYARDAIALGGSKALILVGRILSEEPGMKVCAQWLGTLVPEVRSTWLPAGDPYWRPR